MSARVSEDTAGPNRLSPSVPTHDSRPGSLRHIFVTVALAVAAIAAISTADVLLTPGRTHVPSAATPPVRRDVRCRRARRSHPKPTVLAAPATPDNETCRARQRTPEAHPHQQVDQLTAQRGVEPGTNRHAVVPHQTLVGGRMRQQRGVDDHDAGTDALPLQLANDPTPPPCIVLDNSQAACGKARSSRVRTGDFASPRPHVMGVRSCLTVFHDRVVASQQG